MEEGRIEVISVGMLCGSNDTARETNDKMRKLFCSHPSVDCLGGESCQQAKNNYLIKRKDFVAITSGCEATGFRVLISTLNIFTLQSRLKIAIRLSFIVLLSLRG